MGLKQVIENVRTLRRQERERQEAIRAAKEKARKSLSELEEENKFPELTVWS